MHAWESFQQVIEPAAMAAQEVLCQPDRGILGHGGLIGAEKRVQIVL